MLKPYFNFSTTLFDLFLCIFVSFKANEINGYVARFAQKAF